MQATMIPFIIDALGTVPKGMEQLEIGGRIETIQITQNGERRTVKTETGKINQVRNYISTNNKTELNELINTGAKLVCVKIVIPSKSTKKKIKIRMRNSTRNADKKSTKRGQNDKTKTLEHVETKRKRQYEEK